MKRTLSILTSALVLLFALVVLVGCGGGAGTSDNAEDTTRAADTQEAESLTIDDITFTLRELNTSPGMAPSDMPEGHSPFAVMLDYAEGSGDAAVQEALSILRTEGILVANGETINVSTTAFNLQESFVTLFGSTAEAITSAELTYDGKTLVLM